jgi:hypothetical protein
VFPYSFHPTPRASSPRHAKSRRGKGGSRRSSFSFALFGGLVLAGLSGLTAASAQAAHAPAPAPASTTACASSAVSQPFARWGDTNSYALLPGGDFESTLSEWTLSGGAQRAAGSESFAATGALGGWSLALPAGASVQSPFTCVSASDPTFRLFAHSEGTSGTVLADVVYKTPFGNIAVPVGNLQLKSGWAPTVALPTGAAIASAVSNGTAQMALRFTAVSGSARIDDIFVDPRMR